MRVKTSITLPDDLLRQIDREEPNRSAFLEKAARQYLLHVVKTKRRKADAAILEEFADGLNPEAADVLEYQSIAK